MRFCISSQFSLFLYASGLKSMIRIPATSIDSQLSTIELGNSLAKSDSNQPSEKSIRNLGRYRSYLQLKALGMVSDLRSKIDSSDMVQQTLLEAHQKLDQFRGSTEPEMAAWLGRMLNNNITDAARALRRKKRDVSREKSLEADNSKYARGAGDRLPSEQTTPSLCAVRSEELAQLHEALSVLPESQRRVVILHHLQGKSLAEVAEETDRSRAAVAGLLYRGLKALRATFSK